MQTQTEEQLLKVLTDIRKWIRVTAHNPVKQLLEGALPDTKSRTAFQMLDGAASMDQVRIACKVSPNWLLALTQRCVAMGLMEISADKKRVRLFDLTEFGLSDADVSAKKSKT